MKRDIESCFFPELSMTNIEFYVPLNNVSFVTTVKFCVQWDIVNGWNWNSALLKNYRVPSREWCQNDVVSTSM